jgi:CHAT domain-containing protein
VKKLTTCIIILATLPILYVPALIAGTSATDPDSNRIMRVSLLQALELRSKGNFEKALPYLEKSLTYVSIQVNPDNAVRLYQELAKAKYESREFKTGITYLNYSLPFLKRDDSKTRMQLLTTFSLLQLLFLSNHDQKEGYRFEQKSDSLYSLVKSQEDPSLLSFYLTNCLTYLHFRLNTSKARESLSHAGNIILRTCIESDINFGLLYYYKSQLSYHLRDSEKALGYFSQAWSFLEKYPALIPYMPLLYFNLANTWYFHKDDYDQALIYYQKVVRSRDPWLVSAHTSSLVLSGYCYLGKGDTLKGIQCMKQAIHDALYIPEIPRKELAYTYRCLAMVYSQTRNEIQSIQYLNKALEEALKYHADESLTSTILCNIGNHMRDFVNPPAAMVYYQRALETAHYNPNYDYDSEPLMNDAEIIDILNNQGYAFSILYEMNGQDHFLKEALACQELGIRAIERRILELDDENAEFSWLSTIKTTFDNAVSYASELFHITNDFRYADKAFQYAEKSRMLVLLLSHEDNQIKKYAGIPDTLIKNTTDLHNRIIYLQNQIYQSSKNAWTKNDQPEMRRELAAKQLEYDKLKGLYKSRYPRYYNLKFNENVLHIKELQKFLRIDQAILEYQLLESELITFVITKDSVNICISHRNDEELPKLEELREMLIKDPLENDYVHEYKKFVSLSSSMYEWLIKPAYPLISDKHLIIIPHKELTLIPFEILIKNAPELISDLNYGHLNYLLKSNPISYAYSGTLLFEEKIRRQSGRVAYFLPEYKRSSYPDIKLEGAYSEIYNAKKIAGGKIFSGDHASETLFKQSLNRYNILHIASHTVVDDRNPMLSCLLLSPDNENDGKVFSYEIYQLKFRPQLIILSGCKTGAGRLQDGEGILSLSRSFFYAGARCIAYSMWNSPDMAHASLTTTLYKGIWQKKRLEEALQQSKLKYLEKCDPVKSHPYYWAGMVIMGRTEPVDTGNLFPVIIFGIVAFLVIADVIFLLRTKTIS